MIPAYLSQAIYIIMPSAEFKHSSPCLSFIFVSLRLLFVK
jgi:hypothetical protein